MSATGRGVLEVLGGKMGYSIRGWTPVSERRKAVTAFVSLSVSSIPSCASPMMATACSRLQTVPEWKYGSVSSTLRNGAARNTYSSDTVLVTANRPLSSGGSTLAQGGELGGAGEARKRRPRFTSAQRRRFAAKARNIKRGIRAEAGSLLASDTLLHCYRGLIARIRDCSDRRGPGRLQEPLA
jgi:hypothetical protein